ncbi:hypothetical protein F4825DRAFT_463008 [Nemania diffusa]|nr:hypothetical protein F4825DRAFT_463008 [Nemania diffusa]
MLHNSRLSRVILAGSCRQHAGHEDGKDVTRRQGRSFHLAEEDSRGPPAWLNPVYFATKPPSTYDVYRVEPFSCSPKYTISCRINTPCDPLQHMHLMMPHSHHRGQFIVPTKGKGKGEESVVTAWPAPSDLHIASPSKSTRRPNFSQLGFAQPQTTQGSSQTSNNPALAEVNLRNENHSSNTWTSSSENPDLASEEDRKDDREQFILEYNRLAQRNTIRPLVPGDFSLTVGRANDSLRSRQSSWLSKMLRQASEQSEQVATKPNKLSMRHQRGLGDVAFNLVNSRKPDGLKNRDLRSLIRLCGKSPLFLPTDYAPFSLTLPTCIRALAQALVQHADTRGIFRVPGSVRVIDALYDYYCTNGDTNSISSTTRCPTLPTHIRYNAHDIASTFKRFLAGLPGGILGSLSLFDALVAIHSQLQSNAELHWTKESKLRARLIALAIGTVRSQYQRELICAVFGLLCLVGRIAENAPREDENGRPLPTTDLMGYNALGIVFGPLLIGDMIDNYSMKVADPSAGLVLLPVSPPRSRKEGHTHKHKPKPARHRHRHAKKHTASMAASLTMDKVHIANSITEMLIVHWREVVRQIRSTGSVRTRRNVSNSQRPKWVPNNISSSFSENFSLENPYLEVAHSRSASQSTASPTPTTRTKSLVTVDQRDDVVDEWTPHTRKAGIPNLRPTQKQPMKTAPHLLSPTIEESPFPYIEASELTYGDKRATDDVASKLSQEAYSISSDTRLERVHDSNSTSRLEMIGDNPIADVGSTILDTVQSRGAPNMETSSPSPPLVQQNTASTTPHWDTDFPGSVQTGDTMIVKASSSPSIKIDQSIPWSDSPTIEVTPQRGYDAETLNSNQATPSDDQTKLSQVDSKNSHQSFTIVAMMPLLETDTFRSQSRTRTCVKEITLRL